MLTPKIIETVGSSTAIGGIASGVLAVGNRLADGDVLDAGQADDVAGRRLVDVDALQPVEREQLRDPRRLHAAVELADRHLVADAHAAVEHPADGDAPQVVARIEVRHQHLQAALGVAARRRHVLHDRVEQRAQVAAPARPRSSAGRARPGVGVEHREVELFLGGVEVDEQVVDLVQHLLGARVGTVDLVDDDDRGEAALERLAQHETRLRQRPFRRVHQQQHAVHHRQRPLHLAAEVGVPGRVHDVDQDVVVVDGGVLRQDRDAALALEIGVVHGPLVHALVGAEDTPLCRSRASTSVVLPWSTWAMMATLRRSGLAIEDGALSVHGHPPSIAARMLSAGCYVQGAALARGTSFLRAGT